MSHWSNSTGAHRISEATRFSISPASAGTSEASKKWGRDLHVVGSFRPAKDEGVLPHGSTPPRSGVGEGDVRNCFGKLNDPGKPALRRLGILPQQLRTSPLFVVLGCGKYAAVLDRTLPKWNADRIESTKSRSRRTRRRPCSTLGRGRLPPGGVYNSTRLHSGTW